MRSVGFSRSFGEHLVLDLEDVVGDAGQHRQVGLDDGVEDAVRHHAGPVGEAFGLRLEVAPEVGQGNGVAVSDDEDVPGRAHHRDLAELHRLGLVEVAGGTQHDRQRVADHLDLRTLVRGLRVLEGQRVDPERLARGVELRPRSGRRARSTRSRRPAGSDRRAGRRERRRGPSACRCGRRPCRRWSWRTAELVRPCRGLPFGEAVDTAGHERSLPAGPGAEHLGPCRWMPASSGAASAASSARWQASRSSPSSREPRARSASTPAPPARSASSSASAASEAGLRVAGLPSYQPPYRRHTLWTMNSGSS